MESKTKSIARTIVRNMFISTFDGHPTCARNRKNLITIIKYESAVKHVYQF